MRKFVYLALIACAASCTHRNPKGIDPRVLTLPSFNLQLLDSVHMLNTSSIKKGRPTILINFAPDCSSCSYQTEQLISNYQFLQSVNIYMCSPYPLHTLKEYYNHYGLNRFNNITVAHDVDQFFSAQLKVPSFPWLFIYAPDKKLKKIITGSTDIHTLLKILYGG